MAKFISVDVAGDKFNLINVELIRVIKPVNDKCRIFFDDKHNLLTENTVDEVAAAIQHAIKQT